MIKLNIQRFGHTNSTSNYELPQFIGTDKPQWLTDINQAFASIDTAIHSVSVLANLNSTKIGDLTELTTDNNLDLVSAINEVDSHTDSNTNTIAGHTRAIGDNTNAIGDITDLDTVDKANLVSAINEVDLIAKNNETKIGVLSNLSTDAKSNLVGAINEVDALVNNFNLTSFVTPTLTITKVSDGTNAPVQVSNNNIKIAKNSNGSIFKIYGSVMFSNQQGGEEYKYRFSNTGLPAVNQAYTISNAAITFLDDGTNMNQRVRDLTYETNGDLTFTYLIATAPKEFMYIPNCLYFNSNFGDVPTPE